MPPCGRRRARESKNYISFHLISFRFKTDGVKFVNSWGFFRWFSYPDLTQSVFKGYGSMLACLFRSPFLRQKFKNYSKLFPLALPFHPIFLYPLPSYLSSPTPPFSSPLALPFLCYPGTCTTPPPPLPPPLQSPSPISLLLFRLSRPFPKSGAV